MMRGISITLLPMLAAAALVIWGGGRLARREVIHRTPADRVRLLDFSAALQEELNRIDRLYAGHLENVAARSLVDTPDVLSKRIQEVAAIRQCQIFDGKKQPVQVEGNLLRKNEKLPEVLMEGGKRPFNPEQAVILPKDLGTLENGDRWGWITAPDGIHRIYWQRPLPDHLIAVVIDFTEIQERLNRHLTEWMAVSFSPLRDSGEFVSVTGPDHHDLTGPGKTTERGPAALVIPFRNRLGEWQIQSWDKQHVMLTHDATTVASAIAIAGILIVLGIFLCVQQNRALRLAEERVSFVNRVSHELGSPLTNILLNLDLAADAIHKQPKQAEGRLKLVGEEVQRLARLVSNVLTFSRSERKMLDLKPGPCVPDTVIAGMLAQFQPSLDRRNIRVEWQRGAGDTGTLDPDALAQIVGNLISNVEKYAANGGWLGLDSRIEGDQVKIRVSDHGPGIPVKHRARIFESFERVKQDVNEGSSGTGLGLSIARDLATRMGGDLVLIPSDEGAVFECRLPIAQRFSIVNPTTSAA
ncbi:HAMP domain-containing histidine kinase [Luteolibacter ambystomatis]|uniref:histidine kinase n=1 Tax=Luteolibacter ambystomatis TaxID=2824561 RepID=A0A975PGI8_9BACT|nr:HAMP domain-containing sensor histidine kinase [Luteolibacter ambystomatis]QUE52778.1 HAMP domain-containing histidine kinase [Luteolibacter ambystomatis]